MEMKLVIFDLDNTLWDFETNSRDALAELYVDLNLNAEFSVFHRNYVEINYRYWRDYEHGKITKHDLRYGRFYDAFETIGYGDRKRIDEVADRYLDISPDKTIVFDGTYEILDFLKPKYNLAIITNGFSEVVTRKVRNCRFDTYFDLIQTSEEAGVQKPHPAIFEKVMQHFNVNANESVMIGDNLLTDIAGAKGVNMRHVLFDPKNEHEGYAEEKIINLLQLKSLL